MQKILLLLCVTAGMYACTDSATDDSDGGKSRIEGTVQKGQYIKGSSIVAYRLDETLLPTGESYPSQITDDMGSFSIGSRIDAGYVELRATGYYYNENLHALSESTLDLQAVASVTGSPVHVNLLTTLTSLRIKRLVAAGTAFDQAVSSAEAELFRALGIEGKNFSEHFTDMDITRNRDADAALLAVSCLLQQGRRTAEVSDNAQTPCYGALAPFAGTGFGNPTVMQVFICTAMIRIDLSQFDEKNSVASITLEGTGNAFLSGTASYLIYDDQPEHDPSYRPSDPVFTDRSNRVTAHLSTERELCDIHIYPQLFERLDVILNDKNGNRITQRSVQNIDIRRGALQSLRIL